MITLGLDTSETIGGVALLKGSDIAEERWMDGPLRHAESLLPLIDRLLADQDVSRSMIERISVNIGPGSFTGLRIGLATAKGLSQALGIPLIGIDGMNAIRSRLSEIQRVCVVLRNRRDLLYVQWFAGERPKGDACVVRKGELEAQLDRERREVTLAGSGAAQVYERFRDCERIRLADAEHHRVSPLWVARLGAAAEAGDGLHEVEPMYVEPVLA